MYLFSPSLWSSIWSKERKEKKMDTNTNFSKSNTLGYHHEIISQLPNSAVMPCVTTIASYWCTGSIMTKESHSNSLADRGVSVYEQ